MFWRKTKEAIARFHPLHQQLLWNRGIAATMRPADWAGLVVSVSQHQVVVKRPKWQLPPQTAPLLVPLLRVLCTDARPAGGISVNADFRGANLPGKVGPTRSLPIRRPIRSLVEWYAVDPWLNVRAELRDGSVLRLVVIDRVRYRKRVKSNPRGKIKTKTKTKTSRRIIAVRTMRRGSGARQPAAPAPPWIAVRVKNEGKTTIRATAKLPLGNGFQGQVDQILMVAAEVFRWQPGIDTVRRRRPA
jgi:hypothetical protein